MVWELNWQIAPQLWKCQKGFIETRKNNLKMSDIISRLTLAGHQTHHKENIAVSMHRDTIPMMMDRGLRAGRRVGGKAWSPSVIWPPAFFSGLTKFAFDQPCLFSSNTFCHSIWTWTKTIWMIDLPLFLNGKSELVVRFFRCCLHVVWFPPLLKRGEIAQSYTKSEQKQTKVSKQENSLRHS